MALPGHPTCLLKDVGNTVQQQPVPLLLQSRPAAFHLIVFAVVRRVVNQAELPTRPVGELHHSLEELRAAAAVVRAVVQVDDQSPDVRELCSRVVPPHRSNSGLTQPPNSRLPKNLTLISGF